jgi:hypothetical protein
MAEKVMRLVRICAEFRPSSEIGKVPNRTRGIYVLLQQPKSNPTVYNVVYIGMSKRGVKARLNAHKRSKKKSGLWTHFSVYSVWPTVTDDDVTELEGLFRAIYRRDSTANGIAVAKGFQWLKRVQDNKFSAAKWHLNS